MIIKKLCFVGDVVPSRQYHLCESLRELIKSHDIRIFNLEGAFSKSIQPLFKAGTHLRLDEIYFATFADCFNAAVLANNHSMDYGNEGLATTISVCRSKGIEVVGAGMDISEAFAPLDLGNCRFIAVAEHEFGAAGLTNAGIATTDDQARIYRLIRQGRIEGKLVIILAHGGTELITIPPPYLRDRYRLWVDFGADLVIGSHPHVVQGHEVYQGRHIFYSLGNFAFQADHFSQHEPTNWSILVSVDIELGEIKIIPVISNDKGHLELADSNDFKQHYKRLCHLINSPGYLSDYENIATDLYVKWYRRLAAKDQNDAALLLHFLRCDAHRNILQKALSLKIEENLAAECTKSIKADGVLSTSFTGSKPVNQDSNTLSRKFTKDRSLGLENPFLIVGAGSSGTTLLSVILDRHPLIACGPELSVFNKRAIYQDYDQFCRKLPTWLERGLSTDGQAEYREFFFNLKAYFFEPHQLISLSRKCRSIREFFDEFFSNYLNRRNKKIWGEKTGSNSYCLAEFKNLYPNARIIHVLRDGRDMVCSLTKRPHGVPYHSVSHWLYNVSACIGNQSMDGYLEVRYEDLVTQPHQELVRICNHLGVDFHDSMLNGSTNEYWRSFSDDNIHSSWGSSPLTDSISAKSVGRYKKEMSQDVSDLFWNVNLTPAAMNKLNVSHKGVRDLMALVGYANETPAVSSSVSKRHFDDAVRLETNRALREYQYENRHWVPPTYIAASIAA